MTWVETSGAKLYGKPMRRAICYTVLGTFEVFESISGKAYIIHPLIVNTYIGPTGLDNGLAGWFGAPKKQVVSYEAGKVECQEAMDKLKEKIQEY